MVIKRKNKLKIGELAKRAGVSVPTIRHYLKVGLIERPIKTGKTMAYYDESSVERIKLIKKLQRERFLPLEVIKRVIDSGDVSEDDLDLGRAMFKFNGFLPDQAPVPEAEVESHTGYPLEKIRALDREGLISPTRSEGTSFYGPLDLEIINIMKRREETGVPFDHCLKISKAYCDGIRESVKRDIRIFTTSILGDVTAKQAAKMMTEADESLERFILLYRRSVLREIASDSLKDINRISAIKDHLDFFSNIKDELDFIPSKPEPGFYGVLQLLLRGQIEEALELLESEKIFHDSPHRHALQVLSFLLKGDVSRGFEFATSRWPEPTARPLDNASAALAYILSLSKAKGLSMPIYLLKKGVSYLNRIDSSPFVEDLEGCFARYVCGAIYVVLPDFVAFTEPGVAMLSRLADLLASNGLNLDEHPAWVRDAFIYHIFPSAEVRVNRFLAEGCLKLGDIRGARAALDRIISIAPPGSVESEWARKQRLGVGV